MPASRGCRHCARTFVRSRRPKVKHTCFRVSQPSIMSAINKSPVDPLHIASQTPVQAPKKKELNESKTTNRTKDQAKTMKMPR